MLLSFSVGNFRSFKGEETLNLLASKRLGETTNSPDCCAVPSTGEYALRIASLYGANGAGKSNLVRALAQLDQLVRDGTQPSKQIPYSPFLLDVDSRNQPTSFDLQFSEGGEVFRYGVCFDADRVYEEWLDIYEGKTEKNLFTRSNSENGTVQVTLGPAIRKGTLKKIHALAQVGARPNQLFLTEVLNLDNSEAQGPLFQLAVNWFKTSVQIIRPDTSYRMLAELIDKDEEFAKFIATMLREAGTGISNITVETEKLPKGKFPSKFIGKSGIVIGPDTFIDASGKDIIIIQRILALHDKSEGEAVNFPFGEESDGSLRLLHLLPALYFLAHGGGVFVIDELERSMHPMLARKFVEYFRNAAGESNSQLIFTTHESTLLDLSIMRRDGIWFAEKDPEGASHLYSLADFKVRKDLDIEKGYFQGRFGAIPFLGGIDRLIGEQCAAEAES